MSMKKNCYILKDAKSEPSPELVESLNEPLTCCHVVMLYTMLTSTAEACFLHQQEVPHVLLPGSKVTEASFSKHADILVFLLFDGHIFVFFPCKINWICEKVPHANSSYETKIFFFTFKYNFIPKTWKRVFPFILWQTLQQRPEGIYFANSKSIETSVKTSSMSKPNEQHWLETNIRGTFNTNIF